MYSARYFPPILTQIFSFLTDSRKVYNTKFRRNPSSRIRADTCGWTEGYDEATAELHLSGRWLSG